MSNRFIEFDGRIFSTTHIVSIEKDYDESRATGVAGKLTCWVNYAMEDGEVTRGFIKLFQTRIELEAAYNRIKNSLEVSCE